MKTTIDIADPLLREARRLAEQDGTSVKAVVETSLRCFIEERKRQARGPFKLKDKSFSGRGVQPGIEEGDWRQIQSLIYEGRGA
ncbi:MAG: type II toxin-antitoxin system VapB family antitoxin [Tepidisphaeraceae bacterium]|jgi:hypothetical protein